jgi:uncharacterized membrane protein YfcA
VLRGLATPAYYGYPALYNLGYLLPMLAIVVVFVVTLGGRKLKEQEGRILKLLFGVMMLGLGLVLLLHPTHRACADPGGAHYDDGRCLACPAPEAPLQGGPVAVLLAG